MARRDGAGVRLITRKGNNFSARFPFIAMAVAALPARSCLIDGEAIVTDDAGLAVFELIRRQRTSAAAVLCAFDLLELDGEDLRRLPIENRKRRLAKLLKGAPSNIALNEHFDGDGEIVFEQACKLRCEGIVSKRLGSAYKSGRSRHWLKVKNPAAPAVTREAEEEWDLSGPLDFSRPGKPTDNPYAESFNATVRLECLGRYWFLDLDDAREKSRRMEARVQRSETS